MTKLSEESRKRLAKAVQKKTEDQLRKRLKDSASRKSSHSPVITVTDEPVNMAKYLKGAITKNWNGADREHQEFQKMNKALAEGIGTTGGFLVPTEQERNLIELVREKTVVRNMPGVVTYNMSSNHMEMPRIDSGTTGSWGGENTAISSTATTFGQISLTLRKCVEKVVIPNELIEDSSPAIVDIINRDLTASVALRCDLAYLEGSGGTQPTGIYKQTHINSTDLSASASYDDLWNAIYQIRLQNHELNGWICHPRMENSLRKLKDGEGRYLYDGVTGVGGISNKTPTLLGIPVHYTTQIPITSRPSSNETYIIGADWSQLIIGEKNSLRLESSREEQFSTDQTVIRAVYRTDCTLRHPEAFVVIKGIQA